MYRWLEIVVSWAGEKVFWVLMGLRERWSSRDLSGVSQSS